MILTIAGADFSGANIGTNTTVKVTYQGGCVTNQMQNIERGNDFNVTITLKTDYTYNSLSIKVGTSTITGYTATDNGNGTVSLSIPGNLITGAVIITVNATYNGSGEAEPEKPGTGGNTPSQPTVPTVYKTEKTLGIQILEFGDFKFQSNSTTHGPSYYCQVVAADVSNYVGKSITISTTHAYIKGNSTYGDATYCLFLSADPNGKTPEVLPNVTKLSDLGSTSGNQNMDVLIDKSIIVERFDVVTEATKDTYVTKSVTVPAGAKYVYFTHTRKGGSDKEANIIFN